MSEREANDGIRRYTPYVLPNRPKHIKKDRIKEISITVPSRVALLSKFDCRIAVHDAAVDNEQLWLSCVYWTFKLSDKVLHMLYTFKNKDDGSEEIYILDKINPVPSQNSFSLFAANTGMLLLAFATITNLAKEITVGNRLYIHKRLRAIGAELKHHQLSELSEQFCEERLHLPTLNSLRIRIQLQGAYNALIEDVLNQKADDNHSKAVTKALRMVLEGYGMTAVNQMNYFCSIVTRAHVLDVVLTECENFKKAYDEFKATYPETYNLGRVLNLSGVQALNISNFPHLYTCAIARAKLTGMPGMNRYKTKRFGIGNLKECVSVLESYANQDLTFK